MGKRRDQSFWKDQATYWKKRALTAESIINQNHVNSSKDILSTRILLTQLPVEVLWNIMEFLDLESAEKLGKISAFSQVQVFKYHYFTLQESILDFPFLVNLLGY